MKKQLKKFGEFILKTILRILIVLIRGFLTIYNGIKRFIKNDPWLILLLIILFGTQFFNNRELAKRRQEYQELEGMHQQQMEETGRLFDKNYKLNEELEKTKTKLETELSKSVIVAPKKVVNRESLSEELRQIITKHAEAYGVLEKYAECIVTLESGGRSEATGDNGRAHGVAQYHLGTYLSDAKKVGLPVQDDRRNDDRAILAMMGALSRGEDSKWTVSSSCT